MPKANTAGKIATPAKKGYRYKQAQKFAIERHLAKPKAIKLTKEIKTLIDANIEEDWSPEQIVGKLKKKKVISLHHETIYRYILRDKSNGGLLYKHLRHQNKTYRKRYGSSNNRTGISERVEIDLRPEIVNRRGRFGDWEVDTMIGKNHKGSLVTIDERASKFRLALPLPNRKVENTNRAMKFLLSPIAKHVLTLTFDNGKEFCGHKELACDTYFAKPYQAWQRGQNENANGLLRQYFPKKMELDNIEDEQVIEAVNKLNDRPRKCLGYMTPREVFESQTGINLREYGIMH